MKHLNIRTLAALITACALPMAAQALTLPYTVAYASASTTSAAGAVTFNNFDGINLTSVATTTGGVSNYGSGLGGGNFMSATDNGSNAISISFTSLQDYFGMQWGTNDSYNHISVYNGSTLLYTLNGAGDGSTSFFNLSASSSAQYFNRVVLSSDTCCFEVDNLASRAAPSAAIPEPGALTLVGTALFAAGAARRRRQA